MPGIGEFSEDMGNGFYRNPQTGEVLDSFNGQTFSSEADLATGSSGQMSSAPMSGAYGGQGAGMLAAPVAGYGLYEAATPAATTTGAGLTGAASTVGTGALGAGTGTAGAGVSGGAAATGSMLGPAAGFVAGGLTGYGQLKGASNILQDKKPSWLEHAAMFPITGGLDVLARPFLGGGKHKDQRMRDSYRGGIKENAPGFFDEGKNTVSLSSGASFDWGKDGRNMLQNAGSNIDGNSQRHQYDVDFSRPDSADLTAYLDPLGAIMGRGNAKGTSDMTGYLVNTAQNKGDAISNAKELYQRAGVDYGSARDLVSQLDADQARKDAYYNSLDRLFGQNAYAGKQPAATAAQAKPAAPVNGTVGSPQVTRTTYGRTGPQTTITIRRWR